MDSNHIRGGGGGGKIEATQNSLEQCLHGAVRVSDNAVAVISKRVGEARCLFQQSLGNSVDPHCILKTS